MRARIASKLSTNGNVHAPMPSSSAHSTASECGAAIIPTNPIGVHTLIVGHSHVPRVRTVEGGKLYINTGSWVRMINLDLDHLGREDGLTYALVEYDADGEPQTSLLRWRGLHREFEPVLSLP